MMPSIQALKASSWLAVTASSADIGDCLPGSVAVGYGRQMGKTHLRKILLEGQPQHMDEPLVKFVDADHKADPNRFRYKPSRLRQCISFGLVALMLGFLAFILWGGL